MQKYSVNQHLIETILSWIKSGEIAIPEIQRPFVWDASKVRNFLDSLYQGYPVGYIIAWRNPNVRLKDGSFSEGKKILIDGQQRITALTAALLGNYVVNKNYKPIKIKIAFNPILEKFEVQNSAIIKDRTWLPDVSEAIKGNLFDIAADYLEVNPNANKERVQTALQNLKNLPNTQIGFIELSPELDIEIVTEIFKRINSEGVRLSQADFAMGKIAADSEFGGNNLRKTIDYFCHLATSPEFHKHILDNDPDFVNSEIFNRISWLKDANNDLYKPSYNDLLRVAFTSQFHRGRMSDLVSLLAGRNFEMRTYEKEIAKESFTKLKTGVEQFINETNFKRFLMIIKSAGFISQKLIRSQNVLSFAYIVYLKLKQEKEEDSRIEHLVRRWFVFSILTGRYSSSPEGMIDYDIRQMSQKPISEYLKEKEEGELSDAFWEVSLLEKLETNVRSSPYLHLFLASQVKAFDKGFLSESITVRDMITHRGDVHHLFPKNYLQSNGLTESRYNQIANYVYMQSEINIKISNKSPKAYFNFILNEIADGKHTLTGISSKDELVENLRMNCVPQEIFAMSVEDYPYFLEMRRKLMAEKLRNYYNSL